MRHPSPLILIFTLSIACTDRDVSGLKELLQRADRLAWLGNWYSALPVYTEAENTAAEHSDTRNAMYAKFGRLRGEMQTRSLADLSEELAGDLDTPLAKKDLRLRLRGLTVKGDIDLEWNVGAAQLDWQQALDVANELGDRGWINRATGELGMIAFMRGDIGEAKVRVGQALRAAAESGDIGGQLRYMGSIANGLLLAGDPQAAMVHVDKTLGLAAAHPETGFPYVAYSTKVLTLLALDRIDEAQRFAKAAIAKAAAGDRRIKAVELHMMLAEIAQRRGQPNEAVTHLEEAVSTARAGQVRRLLGDAAAALADAYRARGELTRAEQYASVAVGESEAAGNRFTLPERLHVLAEIHRAQGNVKRADGVYQQATDIVEGVMVNVPGPAAQARLIGVMSDLYTGHFRLAADELGDVRKAYRIVERARGRAIADVLRTFWNQRSDVSSATVGQMRAISQLQVKLMRTQRSRKREPLLDQLRQVDRSGLSHRWESQMDVLAGRDPVRITALQQHLQPNELLLEYVLTEPRSYCFVISAGGHTLVPLASRQRIEPLVDTFVADAQRLTPQQPDVATRLYELVLDPVLPRETKPRLIVVPDGKLHLVPFDTLLAVATAKSRVVTVAPSASVLYLLRTMRARTQAARPLLAVGGVPYDRMATKSSSSDVAPSPSGSRGLYDLASPPQVTPLTFAKEEVLTAARLLGRDSLVLIGEHATESALKAQRLEDFQVLHLAVHGFVDPKFPERTALVLLSDSTAGEDGLLQPREISRLTLGGGLVVLSACDTAVGPTLGQEGVLNLARAFLLAGARSVVTTLWAVDDGTSMELMTRFYEHLTAGLDVTAALAAAKQAVGKQFGAAARPTIAAFQVVGAGDGRIVRPAPHGASGGPNGPRADDARRGQNGA